MANILNHLRPALRQHTLNYILPSLLAVALFVVAVFGVMLPAFEKSILAGKREMIRELTQIPVGILQQYVERERRGELDRESAQARAMNEIRTLRYGPENKDYFWINNMDAVMLMHPYRSDLEHTDMSDFEEPNGFRLMAAFVNTVAGQGHGYVAYDWQWKDDPSRIVPKLSYVQGFAPWRWIVGTGIYLDDVDARITAVTRKLTAISLLIFSAVSLLTALVVQRGLKAETRRQAAVEELRQHHDSLEDQVRERTRELQQANSSLRHEISERCQLEQLLREQAITDKLTGLLNRRGFMTVAEKQLSLARRRKLALLIMFIDMDNLKQVNDSLGHESGDQAISDTAHILEDCFRQADVIGRLGGDEFVVMLTDDRGVENEATLLKRLDDSLNTYNRQQQPTYPLALSTGIIHCEPGPEDQLDELLSQADRATYQIKQLRKSS